VSKFKEIWADSQESEGNTMTKAEELAFKTQQLTQKLRRTPMPLADLIPHLQEMADELRRLAALEQAAEPVPVGFVQALNEHNDEWVSKLPVGTALYTRPARKPMTRDDMRKLLAEHFDNDVLTGDDFRLIRAVERFHDIKE
jgi:aminoglycoside phosphotransferase (APT) family kinase protein